MGDIIDIFIYRQVRRLKRHTVTFCTPFFLHEMQEDWLEVSQADLDALLRDYNRSGVSISSECVSTVCRC